VHKVDRLLLHSPLQAASMAGGNDNKMKGAWACVTGASSGIGMSAASDLRMCCLTRVPEQVQAGVQGWSSSVGFNRNVADDEPLLHPGRAIALALAGEGMNLKLVGRSTEKLQKVLMMSRQPSAMARLHLASSNTMHHAYHLVPFPGL
jgi:hypothetical protein